jgi:hypothetical protein
LLGSWLNLMTEATRLGVETQQVVALRLMKVASGGPAAQTEVARMMTEKIAAAAEAAVTLGLGGSGRKVVRRYRTRVRANARRLSRSARRD